MLVDMNSFFLSVHKAEGNYNINGKASAVAGSESNRHGVILSASYEARKFGVRAGMSNRDAIRLCPNLVLIPPNMELYKRYSKKVMNILREFSYRVEEASIDEAYVDVSDYCGSYDDAISMANEIRLEIKRKLKIEVSIGIATNKIMAKLASDLADRDSIFLIRQNELADKVWSLPIGKLCGVGKKTEEKLHMLNIYNIGELARSDKGLLRSILKKHGEELWKHANGIDNSEVNYIKSLPKSIGHSRTAKENLKTYEEAKEFLSKIADDVIARLDRYGASGSTIGITIKTESWEVYTRQKTRFNSTSQKSEILNDCIMLLENSWDEKKSIRLLGITISNLNYNEEQLVFDI